MIRYQYQLQVTPPAPFVVVTLVNPITGAEHKDLPAQLDTGADRTLLPDAIVQLLALPQIGTVLVAGVGGVIQRMPSYPVELTIPNLPSQILEVVASDGETWILLGRDILNNYRVVLDGPQRTVEID